MLSIWQEIVVEKTISFFYFGFTYNTLALITDSTKLFFLFYEVIFF